MGEGTYAVVVLVESEGLAHFDPFLEHQRILNTVNNFEKELLFGQEILVGNFNFMFRDAAASN